MTQGEENSVEESKAHDPSLIDTGNMEKRPILMVTQAMMVLRKPSIKPSAVMMIRTKIGTWKF